MTTPAIKQAPLSERLGMAPAQLELIRRMCIREDAPDDVLELYLHRCKSIGVDPFDKMIYVIPRRQNVKNEKTGAWSSEIRWTFQSSIDLFRSVAEDNGDYAGQLGPFWTGDGVTWVDVWLAPDPPMACKVGVLRKSFKEPLWVTGTYAYYVPRDGKGNPAPTAFWNGEKGAHQLAKCVEELALRKAFPRRLHGIYGDEEMLQADRAPSKRKAVQEQPIAGELVDETPVADAAFAELPPPPEEPDQAESRARESGKKHVMIYARENNISDEHRHEITQAFFGQPSTKELSSKDLRTLYALLLKYVRSRNDVTIENVSEWTQETFEFWLELQVREAKAAS